MFEQSFGREAEDGKISPLEAAAEKGALGLEGVLCPTVGVDGAVGRKRLGEIHLKGIAISNVLDDGAGFVEVSLSVFFRLNPHAFGEIVCALMRVGFQ